MGQDLLLCDFHVHTTYSDGAHTPTEVAAVAYEMGMTAIGFSTHSYTHFDESYCIMPDRIETYLREIAELKRTYAGRMQIFCGVEQDCLSDYPTDAFDYVIGSVHYLQVDDTYYAIDHRRDILLTAVEEGYGGDVYAMIEAYYETVAALADRVKPDLIGHFDVITKFNEKAPFFDETHPRYLAARQAALDRLLSYGVPFEVNTGAMFRGYKTSPYPAADALAYIRAAGGSVLPTSDSHMKGSLCHAFSTMSEMLSAHGFSPRATQEAFLARLTERKKRDT